MQKIYDKLNEKIQTPSDINEHLETLLKYSSGCKHITEMGTREITSTWAFLAGEPTKFVGIDIYVSPNMSYAQELCKENDIEFEFLHKSTLEPGFVIEETDFLFIDTAHTYAQLKQELERHGNQAKRLLGFHDTTTYGHVNEPPYAANAHIESAVPADSPKGLVPAIEEFLAENPHWKIREIFTHNNGVTILERNQ